ncbi:MAG: TonB-dependent receptor [Acidobacteria bacterium]|nr:TonB-dependent receptor [Acidobacteriota bacterium]
MKPVFGHLLGFEACWKRNLLVVMFTLLVTSLPVLGQERVGTIAGTVTDPTGAVIPEVKVTVRNIATNRTLTTNTVGDGTYRIPEIEPGRYSVSFEKSGFAKYELADAIVLVGKTLRVDAALTVGSLTQTIEVTEAPPVIDTASTMVAHNVTAEEFSRLPKPRNFDGIAIFSPSVSTGFVEGGYQINGASGAENNFYIDGVSTTSVLDGSLRQNAKFEHLAEVQVKTTGIEAEYGGALGGVVSGVTRSGGNQLHGSVFWYYYGSKLNVAPSKRIASDLTTKYTLAPVWDYIYDTKPIRNNYDAGGTLGGPILKDKLFFFTSFAPTWQRRTVPYNFADGSGSMDRKALFMSWFNKIDFNPTSRIRTNFTWLYTPTYLTGSLFAFEDMCQNCSTNTIADAASVAGNGFYQPEQSMTGTINVTLSPSAILSVKGGRYYLNYKETGNYPTTEYWYQTSSIGIPGIDPSLEHAAGYTTQPPSGHVLHDITTRTYVQADVSKYLHLGGEHDLKFGIGTQKNVNNVLNSDFGAGGRVELYPGATSITLLSQNLPVGQYGYYAVNDGGTIGSTGALITHLYVQDAWRIHPRLTINAGLRTERETIPSYRRDLKDYAFKFGFGDKIAPRIGASYDLFGNGKVKLSGFWGRFFDWTKYEVARGAFGADV